MHLTDISNAAATGFFDPFVRVWGFWSKVLGIPHEILPDVVPNDYDFGVTLEEIFWSRYSNKMHCKEKY